MGLGRPDGDDNGIVFLEMSVQVGLLPKASLTTRTAERPLLNGTRICLMKSLIQSDQKEREGAREVAGDKTEALHSEIE